MVRYAGCAMRFEVLTRTAHTAQRIPLRQPIQTLNPHK